MSSPKKNMRNRSNNNVLSRIIKPKVPTPKAGSRNQSSGAKGVSDSNKESLGGLSQE